MRQTANTLAGIVLIGMLCWSSVSAAAFFSFPRALGYPFEHITFLEPALAPMAHTMFCLRYQDDCQIHKVDFRKRNVALTAERLNQLNRINREVNRAITPQPNLGGLATEEWIVSPPAGDCNDYAVTKRHKLLALGWPARSLLLSEVVVPSGEHHLILAVRGRDMDSDRNIDLVLDNLNYNLRLVGMTTYQWVRVQSPINPKYWSTVSVTSRFRTALSEDPQLTE